MNAALPNNFNMAKTKELCRRHEGFTLIELMIVIAIVGILSAIAVPQYDFYARRAAFSEIKLAAEPIKAAIEVCWQRNGGPGPGNECNEAAATPVVPGQTTNGMLLRGASASLVNTVTLTSGAIPIITVTPQATEGFTAADTYVLTGVPNALRDGLTDWTESGGACFSSGLC